MRMKRRHRGTRSFPAADPAHAPGKRKRALGPQAIEPGTEEAPSPMHDQPWIPTSRLLGRFRRSARRS